MFSFIKRPIGFTLAYVVFAVAINKLLENAMLPYYATYAISALVAVAFTVLFNWLLKVQLSEQFRFRISYYIAVCMFIISIIAILGALYYKPAIIGIKGEIETMPTFMLAFIGFGSSALLSAMYGAISFLLITFGNLLSKSVVKNGTVL